MVAHIYWGYHVAAALHGFTVEREKEKGAPIRLRGTVVSSDAFKLAQSPLLLVVPHAGGGWRFTIETLSIREGAVSATLTPYKGAA